MNERDSIMKNIATLFLLFVFISLPAQAQAQKQESEGFVKSVTVEGGYIWTKHIQGDDEDFRERHGLAIVKVETQNYGRWGIYYLAPNSVRDTSVGFGYVTPSWDIPLGPTALEISGALGIVTGYQDFPVPLVAGQARLNLYESQNGRWNAGIAAAALPYVAENQLTGDNDFGVVVTTPFLSIRHRF